MAVPFQLSFNLDFRPAYGRGDFFVGRSNQMAIDTIEKWPDWGITPFLIIYGDEGSGKKHIASVWRANPAAQFFDAKTFPDADLDKILKETPNIVIHQLHLLLGERDTEEKLFHIYNHYIGLKEKRSVLITSRFAPGELDVSLPDLRSRLNGSMTAKIENPDDILLMQVLGKQLHDKGFQPTEDLLNYAIKLMERSWSSPKRLSDILNKMSLEEQKGLTKKMIREAIINIEQGSEVQRNATVQPAIDGLNHS